MASTVPAKSNNPLHNFDLPHLKWKKNNHHSSTNTNSNHHQRRRSSKHGSPSRQSQSPLRDSVAAARHSPLHDPARHSPMRESFAAARGSPLRDPAAAVRRSPMSEPVTASRHSSMRDSVRRSPMRESFPPARQSPMRESVAAARESPVRDPLSSARDSPMRCGESDKHRSSSAIEYRRNSRISSVAAPEGSTKQHNRVPDKKHKVQEAVTSRSSSKILIKIPRKNKAAAAAETEEEEEEEIHEDQQQQKATDESQQGAADEEPKTWNLRPRKPIHKSLNLNSGGPLFKAVAMQENKSQNVNSKQPVDQSTASEAQNKKEKKQNFSIAVTREEIDEDFYALTGLKAPRRPKKRAKIVQKHLDTLFPGLWLASITPDSYKVCENLPKG